MFRYVLLSISCLLLLTACGEGLTGQTGGEKPAGDGNPQDVGKDVPRFLNQPNPQSCSDCVLTRGDLTGVDMTEADLIWADLSGANLRFADLTDADLTMANLHGAYLDGVIGADFSGAKNAFP